MYGIDADTLTVWIQAIDVDAPSRPGVLCRRHADAMVVPLRWTLDDRREAIPRLFRPPASLDLPPDERPRRVRPHVVGTQLELDDTAEIPRPAPVEDAPVDDVGDGAVAPGTTAISAEPGVAGPAVAAVAWKPVFDPDDDLDGLLQTRSPLLSRAFHGRERRRAE
jgi:hypothetical protein